MQKLFFVFVLLGVIILTTLLYASTDFQDTPVGKRAQEVVNLFNDEHAQSPMEYASENFSESLKKNIASPGSGLNQLKNVFGNVTVVEISESENEKISFTIKSTTHNLFLNIQLEVESEKPHLISSIRLMPTGKPLKDAENNSEERKIYDGKKMPVQELKKILDQYIDGIVEKNEFSGTVLIAKEGSPIYTRAVGFAHKGFKVPNKLNTKFNLGSLNKSFTAVAILQLVEKGKISIDDPIGKYLDYFPKNIREKVTIRHLLTMSSGWGDYWGNEYYLAHKDQLRSVSDYMEFIKDIPIEFEPGTRTQHCNTGYEVAGAIIEKVSGMDYFDYIREHIYFPADMKNSGTFDRDGPVENLAVGYTNQHPADKVQTGFKWENTYILSPRGTPAGGGYSTVEDMLNYDQALRNHKPIGKDYVNFLNNRFQGSIGDPYKPRGTSRHVGGASGVSTLLARDLINGYTVIVLSNYDFPTALSVGNEIIKKLGI